MGSSVATTTRAVSLAATIDARQVPRETAAAMYLGEPERSIEEVVSSLCVRRVERPDFFFVLVRRRCPRAATLGS